MSFVRTQRRRGVAAFGVRVQERVWTVMGTRDYWVPVGEPVLVARALNVFAVPSWLGILLECICNRSMRV